MENLAHTDSKLSCPIVAVQTVMHNLLAQCDNQLSLYDRLSHRNYGSRLRNTIGLNITDHEYVDLKLKQKEKQKRYHKLCCSQADATISAGKPGRKSKATRNLVKNSAMDKENQPESDSKIGDAIHRLDDTMNITDTIFERQLSMEEL